MLVPNCANTIFASSENSAKNDRRKMGRLGLGLGILFWGIEEKEDEDVERYETNFYIYVNKI